MIRITISAALFLLFHSTFSQSLSFYKENLRFTIEKDQFFVDGVYFFRNNTADTLKQLMLYPFPEKKPSGEITEVSGTAVYPSADTSIIRYYNHKAAHFKLIIFPYDTAVIQIRYTQKIKDRTAEYILTSTRVWKNPLEKAVFELRLPACQRIDSLSYDADSLIFVKETLLYKWSFVDFMPDKNFFVSFRSIE